MTTREDTAIGEYLRSDRDLFSSLLKHIVQAAPDEDASDYVLATIGRNVGADRCYVYRFWEPGKSSLCTNTHEWCADGIKPEICGQQACNLADLVEFNACITSGRDFLFADIDKIDDGSRKWLAPQGIKSLIATPLVESGGTVCGFVGFDFVKAPCKEFTDRIIFNIHETANLIISCQRVRERNVALNITRLKSEVVEYLFMHGNYDEFLDFLGVKLCGITGAQHLMLCTDDGARKDWFGEDAPSCCRDCVEAAVKLGKRIPQELFANGDSVIIRGDKAREGLNLPRYCPMCSSVVCQLMKNGSWWRMAVDYTKPHKHDMNAVARGLRTALEFLFMAQERHRRETVIGKMQAHQQFRADALAYALARDDLPRLIDFIMRRLLKLTACDYIAIHSVDGHHRMLHPGEEAKACPKRCEACSFYKLLIPPIEDADHFVELKDAKGQTITPLPSECPAKSLEVVVVYRDGKPWGGIALHYVNRQYEISEDDRYTLMIAANVLTLALERHSSAVRLRAERDRVVEAEKARSYFFSAVSHDIRTPLNAIIGFSQLLQSGEVPPEEAKQYNKMIVSSGNTLLQLVNDVIDLSKMDLGKLEFTPEPTDVAEVVKDVALVFQAMTAEKGQTIGLDIGEMPRLMVDAHRLRQILFNFVSNAVKYAGPCAIRVSMSYADGLLKLTVADNGKGVSAEKAKRLMQPFVQADIKNRTEGSGLGLAICKRLVEIMHGTISIKTALGEGFAIHVEAPVKVAAGAAAKRKSDEVEKLAAADLPKRVLVVDDSPVNRIVLRAILKKLGVKDIKLVEDGKVALETLEGDPSFDLVMSDMWMPVMDGAELVKRIRADPRLAHLKVCSISADVETRANYRELGFDEMLLKPVTIEKLTDFLKRSATA